MEDMAGGSFTVSNGGVFGSLMGTPIINPPQVFAAVRENIQQWHMPPTIAAVRTKSFIFVSPRENKYSCRAHL